MTNYECCEVANIRKNTIKFKPGIRAKNAKITKINTKTNKINTKKTFSRNWNEIDKNSTFMCLFLLGPAPRKSPKNIVFFFFFFFLKKVHLRISPTKVKIVSIKCLFCSLQFQFSLAYFRGTLEQNNDYFDTLDFRGEGRGRRGDTFFILEVPNNYKFAMLIYLSAHDASNHNSSLVNGDARTTSKQGILTTLPGAKL